MQSKLPSLKVSLNDLYNIADNEGITVMSANCPECCAISMMSPSGKCYIGMDYSVIENERQERQYLAHDMGHCESGAFYNKYSPFNVISQQEFRANKKALQYLVPREELEYLLKNERLETWELCEYFDVDYEYIQIAFWVYFDKRI